jgi:hypothetical protein
VAAGNRDPWKAALTLFHCGNSQKRVTEWVSWQIGRTVTWGEIAAEWNRRGFTSIRRSGAAPQKVKLSRRLLHASPRCTECGEVTKRFLAMVEVRDGKMGKWDGNALCLQCSEGTESSEGKKP